MATQAQAFSQSRKYAGEFDAQAEAKEGKTTDDVEKALLGEIEKLKKDLVPAEELQKVKNNFAAQTFRALQANPQILLQLMGNEGRGDWREFNEGPKKIQAVTAEDVRRVAQAYFTKENRGVAVYTGKAEPLPRRKIPRLPPCPSR